MNFKLKLDLEGQIPTIQVPKCHHIWVVQKKWTTTMNAQYPYSSKHLPKHCFGLVLAGPTHPQGIWSAGICTNKSIYMYIYIEYRETAFGLSIYTSMIMYIYIYMPLNRYINEHTYTYIYIKTYIFKSNCIFIHIYI